jgi:lysophospholipase L1-like esterase
LTRRRRSGIGGDVRSLFASLSLLLAAFTVSVTAQEKAWEPKPRARSFPWMSYADWNSMHDAMLRRALQGDVDVLFLGDSITQGWADNAVWKQRYVPRKPANFGIGGDTTQNVLWRIENGSLVGIDPKVVVLLIGTNNLGIHDDSPDDVAKGVGAIVRSIHRRSPGTKVLLLAVFPRDERPGTKFRKAIAAINPQIAKLDDGKTVRFLDIGEKFLAADGTLPKDVMPDALHLSEKGYAIWADAMEPLLAEMLRR